MYCDRETTDVPKSQAGFIRNIVLPLYEILTSYLDSKIIEESCLEQIKSNLSTWEYETNRNRVKTLTQPIETTREYEGLTSETPRYRRVGTQRIKDYPESLSWLHNEKA